MSCGEPHETDCSEVLDHLYEYLDREMPDADSQKFREHFDECSPCLEKYGLEQEVKKLVKRCCGHDEVPSDLRAKVMGRIEVIRAAEAASESADVTGTGATWTEPSAQPGSAQQKEERSESRTEPAPRSAQLRNRPA